MFHGAIYPVDITLTNTRPAPHGVPASIDFETRSTVDLKSAGARRYAQHPDTRVLCMFVAIGPAEAIWVPGMPMPQILADAIARGEIIQAWNATFEVAIWQEIMVKRHGWPDIPAARFRCTMQKAALVGCPGALERAVVALGLPIAKDMDGHRLMLKMCKPLPARKDDPPSLVRWHDDPLDHLRIQRYCRDDVRAEVMAAAHLPEPPPMEVAVMRVDREINLRGIRVDRAAAEGAAKIAREEKRRLNAEIARLTDGAIKSTNQVAVILDFVNRKGIQLDALRASDVRDFLNDYDESDTSGDLDVNDAQIDAYTAMHGGDPAAVQVLRLRAEAAKASTAKLDALVKGVSAGDRMTDLFAYSGAYRTQRWCLPAYTPVTVLRGGRVEDVRIVDVRRTDRVWDGTEWVAHEGVVFSGVKPVITHDGVVASPDHYVFTDGNTKMRLEDAAYERRPIWRGYTPLPDIHPASTEWLRVCRFNLATTKDALGQPPSGCSQTHDAPSPVRHDTEVRPRQFLYYGVGSRCRACGRANCGAALDSNPTVRSKRDQRRGSGQSRRYGAVLGGHAVRPGGAFCVQKEAKCGLQSERHTPKFGGQSAGVARRKQPYRLVRQLPRDTDRTGCPAERAMGSRSAVLQMDWTSVATERRGAESTAVLCKPQDSPRTVGDARSNPTAEGYGGRASPQMGIPIRDREGCETGATRCGTRSPDAFRGSEEAPARGDTSILGEGSRRESRYELCFDIVNAGPRNRFRAWGRIVSNSGRRFQAHNLPRANPPCETHDEIERWYETLAHGRYDDFCDLLPLGKNGKRMTVMDGLKASLRGFLMASAGCNYVVADLGQIEARGAAWIAGQWDLIHAFERLDAAVRAGADEATLKGLDIYTVNGRKMNVDRQGGKIATLACGYQGGWNALMVFAAAYGTTFTEIEARNIVDAYRAANPMIVRAWAAEERAAIQAMENPGMVIPLTNGRDFTGAYCFKGGNLMRKLPSGRCLIYRRMAREPRPTAWGKMKLTLTYEGNIFAKGQPGTFVRLSTYGGKLFQNATQAICRDILAAGLIRSQRFGLPVALHVHDEQGIDSPAHLNAEHAELVVKAATDPIDWVPGLPVTSSADISYRYRKG